jgi:hypothetical protein
LPQLHALPLFIGQFLPVFLHDGWSAANALAQIMAATMEQTIFVYLFIQIQIFPRTESCAKKFMSRDGFGLLTFQFEL